MNNIIISYAKLSKDLKGAFKNWLQTRAPELISFPFRGKHMRGYIFSHESNSYLVVMQSEYQDMDLSPDIEMLDLNEEF